MMLTNSIVTQIIEQNRNKLFNTSSSAVTMEERALFGGTIQRFGNSAQDRARTFEEEAAAYTAVTKMNGAANKVPRVRMNRILGSGQTGGRRFGVDQQQQQSLGGTLTSASATTGGGASASVSTNVAMGGTTLMFADASATQRTVTFQSPAKSSPATINNKSDTEMVDANDDDANDAVGCSRRRSSVPCP